MNTNFFRTTAITLVVLYMAILLVLATSFSCTKDKETPALKGIFYVAGYDSPGIDVRNDGIAEPGAYLFIYLGSR